MVVLQQVLLVLNIAVMLGCAVAFLLAYKRNEHLSIAMLIFAMWAWMVAYLWVTPAIRESAGTSDNGPHTATVEKAPQQ